MNKSFLLWASSLLIATSPAYAWDTQPSTALTQKQAQQATAQAQALARAAARVRNEVILRSTSRNINTATNNANNSSTNYSSASPTQIVNGSKYPNLAAGAYAPSFASTDPCVGRGNSGGVQGPWFGVSLGFQHKDVTCGIERLGNLSTVGQRIDFMYQCEHTDGFRDAAAAAGLTCPPTAAERQREQRQREAIQQQVSSIRTQEEDLMTTLPHGFFGYCSEHMTPAERQRHPECK